MDMKECKQKIKAFASKHKKKLIVAGAVGAGLVGGLVGWKLCDKVTGKKYLYVKKDSCVGKILSNASAKYNGKPWVGFADSGRTYTCDQLGEFGEVLVGEDADLSSKVKFTQIVAFGGMDE